METKIINEIKEKEVVVDVKNDISQQTKKAIVEKNNKYFDNQGNLVIEKQLINEIGNRLKSLDIIANEIKKALVAGIDNDYAIIPGTKKPSLLQPGARKIALMLGLTAKYDTPQINNNVVVIKCELFSANNKISECYGAETIAKTNRSVGWEFNKSLKIAQKRAFVGAVLTIANLTKLFTQDMEDSGVNYAELKQNEITSQDVKDFYNAVKNANKLSGFVNWNQLKPLVEAVIVDFNRKNDTTYSKINEFSKEHFNKLMDDNKFRNNDINMEVLL